MYMKENRYTDRSIDTSIERLLDHRSIDKCIFIYAHMHAPTHRCIYIYIYTYMSSIYTYTYIRTCIQLKTETHSSGLSSQPSFSCRGLLGRNLGTNSSCGKPSYGVLNFLHLLVGMLRGGMLPTQASVLCHVERWSCLRRRVYPDRTASSAKRLSSITFLRLDCHVWPYSPYFTH